MAVQNLTETALQEPTATFHDPLRAAKFSKVTIPVHRSHKRTIELCCRLDATPNQERSSIGRIWSLYLINSVRIFVAEKT